MEWINRYVVVVVRSVRVYVGDIGVIEEFRVFEGDLDYMMDVGCSGVKDD